MHKNRQRQRWALGIFCVLALGACSRSGNRAPPDAFAYWQQRLDDPNQRAEALAALGRLRDPRGLAPLRRWLEQPGPQQPDAARALGWMGDTNEVPLLAAHIDATAGDDNRLRMNRAVLAALRRLDLPAAMPHVRALLASPSAEVRAEAVAAIGAAGDPNAAADLLLVFMHDPQLEISRQAALALADIGAYDTAADLVRALYRDAWADAARLALVQMGEHGSPVLLETLARRNVAVEMLRGPDHRRLPDGTIEARAGATLGAMRAPAGEAPVLEALKKLYAQYRAHPSAARPALFGALIELAYAAGNYGGAEAAQALIPLLRAPAETLRATAAEALTNAGPSTGVAEALASSAAAGSADTFVTVATALTRLGDDNDLAPLRRLARKGNKQIPPAEVRRLLDDAGDRLAAQRQCRDDIACWRDKSRDPSDHVRERAALELGWRRAETGVTNLLRLAQDANADVRLAAVLSLQRMPKGRVPLEALQKIYEVEGGKLQYAAANQELKCLIARQKGP